MFHKQAAQVLRRAARMMRAGQAAAEACVTHARSQAHTHTSARCYSQHAGEAAGQHRLQTLGGGIALLAGGLAVGGVAALVSDVSREWEDFSGRVDRHVRVHTQTHADAHHTGETSSSTPASVSRLAPLQCVETTYGRMRYADLHPTNGSAPIGTVLVASGSVSLLSHITDALLERGLRVIATEAEPSGDGTFSFEGAAMQLSEVLNACGVEGQVTVLTSGFTWPAAVHFANRNSAGVSALIALDPLWPDAVAVDTPAARNAARADAHDGVLRLRAIEPVHALEHLLTGTAHHHLFCGMDHHVPDSQVEPGPSIASAATRSSSTAVAWVKWRSGSAQGDDAASSGPATRHGADDYDTLEPITVVVERIYRDRLHAGERAVSLVEMMPTFAQSLLPSVYRGMQLYLPLLGTVAVPPDVRISQLDAEFAALREAIDTQESADAGVLQTLRETAARVPVQVRVSMPTNDMIADSRWDPRQRIAVAPSTLESELRERLQHRAREQLGMWRSVLPGRCTEVPACTAISRHSVLDADADAMADMLARVARNANSRL